MLGRREQIPQLNLYHHALFNMHQPSPVFPTNASYISCFFTISYGVPSSRDYLVFCTVPFLDDEVSFDIKDKVFGFFRQHITVLLGNYFILNPEIVMEIVFHSLTRHCNFLQLLLIHLYKLTAQRTHRKNRAIIRIYIDHYQFIKDQITGMQTNKSSNETKQYSQ